MTNHTIHTNAPSQCFPYPLRCLPRNDKVENFDSIGRIHNIMTIASIGETVIKLSPQTQKYFSSDIIKNIKDLRNMIFHPEHENNWNDLEKLINNGEFNDTFKDFIPNILKGYEIAAEVLHFLAGRKFSREPFFDFDTTSLFESKEAFLKTVSDQIPQLSKYYTDYTYSIQFLENECYSVPLDILWNYVKNGLNEIKIIEPSKTDAKEPGKTKKAEDAAITNEVPKTAHDLNIEVLKKWNYLEKRLLKCDNEIKKMLNILDEYEDKYEAALYHYQAGITYDYCSKISSYYESGILSDYPNLLHKHCIKQKARADVINSINLHQLIDDIEQQVSDLCILASASNVILPRLLFSLEKINYYYSLLKNPSFIATISNSVGPLKSTLDFFTMLAGSLVRSYSMDNTTILKNLNDQFIILDDKKITLSNALKKLREKRGVIAHENQPKAGHLPNFIYKSELSITKAINMLPLVKFH